MRKVFKKFIMQWTKRSSSLSEEKIIHALTKPMKSFAVEGA
jgi:hypothetical protein